MQLRLLQVLFLMQIEKLSFFPHYPSFMALLLSSQPLRRPGLPLWQCAVVWKLALGILWMTSGVSPGEIPSGPTELSRYQKIWEISPFVAVTDLSGQADDLAGRFVVTGFARMGSKDVVFVFDRTTLERFALTPGETRNGVALQSLSHQGDLRSVRATLASGGRSLEISYDPASVPDANAGMPMVPGQMGQPQQQHRGYPGQPQPHMGGAPPGQSMPGQPATPATPSNPNAIIGAPPSTAMPGNGGEAAPPPRRVIRRRAIVAPE